MSSNIGTLPQGRVIPGAAPRKLTADVVDTATIGFRAAGRLVVLHAMPSGCEVRDYGRAGKLTVLATLGGARQIACEDTGGRLTFSIDGAVVLDMPAGRDRWEIYQS